MPTQLVDRYPWWAALKHGGLLISPSKLQEFFPPEAESLPRYQSDRLRREVTRFQENGGAHLGELLNTVLEEILDLPSQHWMKGTAVDTSWSQYLATREILKPRRLWQGPDGGTLPVFVATDAKKIGVGRGRRAVSRVVEWLRKSDQKLALLTNGWQWRLIHAGADYDAWCEWDAGLWFEEGVPSAQVDALRLLLAEKSLTPQKDGRGPLLEAILASRKGQAELSSTLGERVRQAVEILIRESSTALNKAGLVTDDRTVYRDIYIAACRIIMRCVVILFAEARELLPRENPIYDSSYGLQALREQLERQAAGRGEERLRHGFSAWPRMLSLFRLVYEGSGHEALPVVRYGGDLFAPGDPSSDRLSRAIAAFEDASNEPNDAVIYRILRLLCLSQVKVRQGRSSTWVMAPIDFSDLSSEYIGILYEGLLDYELRRAGDEPMVFLNLGDQPVLPFSRVDTMTNKNLAELVGKLRERSKSSLLAEADEEEEKEEDTELELDEKEIAEETEEEEEVQTEQKTEELDDNHRVIEEMVQIWGERAVKAAKIVPYPKDDSDPLAREAFQENVQKAARNLVSRIVMPGEWFLVRWGGTRKGSGTFYTRPQLAGPTVHRTLRPLAYEALSGTSDNADPGEWKPKKPEEILGLKVCDPAMGSGSFLISALRFLVDALLESLHQHERLKPSPDRTICKLADGLPLDQPSQETLPVPLDHPDFEDRLRARLKRHVVERCLYGVDIDPLAVELARMALWIETMDRTLPFGFLDHKLKCGNSLVGCWFDRFQDYPVMAWEREGGDKNHDRFVHHYREYEVRRGKHKGEIKKSGDQWTAAIKGVRNGRIKSELEDWITGQRAFAFLRDGQTPEGIHDRAMKISEELHDLPVHETEQRAVIYQQEIANDPDFRRLRHAFDTWCAVWFWPADLLDLAPTPSNFLQPSQQTQEMVYSLAEEHRFFHWELEFPDVFRGPEDGFDAVLGNPPWEIQKPNSKEFFSNADPLYRTYGKQEALDKQRELFENEEIEREWLSYCARLKALSNWNKHVASPFGDPEEGGPKFSISRSAKKTETLHRQWRERRRKRSGYADPRHPFRHQGSADINTYKMFLEAAHVLITENGYLGMLTPSGLYTDLGSTSLRGLFLNRCSWKWLFGFENREKVFDIDSRFKFCPVIVQKGGQTTAIQAAFMHRSLEDWEEAEKHALDYPAARIHQFSPKSKAILEIRSQRDLEVLNKLYSNGVLLGDESSDGWNIKYATEFHMTNDSHLFPPRPQWEAKGYRPDEYGHWLKGNWQDYDGPRSILKRKRGLVLSQDGTRVIHVDEIEDVALPLYEGRMIGQFDFSEKGWVSGKGRSAVWRDLNFDGKVVEPQYLMAWSDVGDCDKSYPFPKVSYMRISSATNSRTTISTYLRTVPAGDSVFFFRSASKSAVDCLAIVGFFNSFVFDYQARNRLGGLNMSEFVMIETALPTKNLIRKYFSSVMLHLLGLSLPHHNFAQDWIEVGISKCAEFSWREVWAITKHERVRKRCLLDAVMAQLYGSDYGDFAYIMRDCNHASSQLSLSDIARKLDPKGFWRVDKDKDPELRHTVLSLVAFHDLKEKGLDEFLNQNHGEGWMIPEQLRLADYGLGHDHRAKEYQPVASRLGPRFYDWQLEQSAEESWEECEAHAELIQKIVPPPPEEETSEEAPDEKEVAKDLFGDPLKTDLFGNVVYPKSRKR
ncbi:BREX-1 system adenine-specific DNA-methyltransferase PglX [Acidobacteria bacterium AH-259-L09]|nr:BREX-1 system adenine-specific DNA-methyltransferase PglX [Acidobacteria bacterium AH-259-L09]